MRMRVFWVTILSACILGSRLRHEIIIAHPLILVPAGLGKAAEAMAELCVLLGLFLNIYVGIIIWYKFLQSDKLIFYTFN